jgi:hypothetical protein
MSLMLVALQVAIVGSFAFVTSLHTATMSGRASFLELLPSIASALGTILAFGVTAALFIRGSRDRRREQATKVFVTTEKRRGEIVATVHNRSELPIWKVEAMPMRSGHIVTDGIKQPQPNIPPDGESHFVWSGDGDDSRVERDWRIRFIDAADRVWVRVGHQLTKESRLPDFLSRF